MPVGSGQLKMRERKMMMARINAKGLVFSSAMAVVLPFKYLNLVSTLEGTGGKSDERDFKPQVARIEYPPAEQEREQKNG